MCMVSRMFPGLDLPCKAYPVHPLTTAGEELYHLSVYDLSVDDLPVDDLHDLSVDDIYADYLSVDYLSICSRCEYHLPCLKALDSSCVAYQASTMWMVSSKQALHMVRWQMGSHQ